MQSPRASFSAQMPTLFWHEDAVPTDPAGAPYVQVSVAER